jgi:hypothetical protein
MIRQEPQVVLNRSTNLVGLKGLVDKSTIPPTYPIDATVTCTLLNGAGDPMAGATSIPMPYISGMGRNSLYRGVLDSEANYAGVAKARITITRSGATREINCACVARDG